MVNVNVRPDIDAAAARMSTAVGAKREIARLPEVLWEGETVEMLAAGMYGGGTGLLAMTNLRLVFFKHGIMSQKLEDFPYGIGSRLATLDQLRAAGAITDAEYQDRRAKILDSL